jgi:hypothetical protein
MFSSFGAWRHEGAWVAVAAFLFVAPATFGAEEEKEKSNVVTAEVSAPVTPYVFDGDVRDLPPPAAWKPGDPVVEVPKRLYPKPGFVMPEYETGIDPLLELQQSFQVQRDARVFTAPNRNFAGQGFTGVNPPDTVGDVGPSHYVQIVNSGGGAVVRIWDKAEPTPNVLATFSMDSLSTGGVCTGGFGDGIVLHDQFADRWVLTEFSGSGNAMCVYVSQTDNPVSGGWFAYTFVAPSFPDYPKYGVWPTDANGGQGSYIVTTNESGCGVYALNRGAMLTGAPATFQRATIPDLPGFPFNAVTPADVDGPTPPPSGSPAVIMRQRDTENHGGPPAPGDVLEMWTYNVDWVTTGNTALTQQPNIDIAEIDSALCGLSAFACFPQPGTGTTLDPLREVIMNRLQYSNFDNRQALVGNCVTDVNGADHGGLRWFELEKVGSAWTLRQEGTYAIDADHRWMAASAMDQSGNIAIAYNVSSTTTFPSLRYTGRQFDDPLGVMTQAETSIHAGTASNSSNRYGDYSGMNLDPVDDCTFWFTGMDNTSSSWRTQVASFKFDACGCLLFPGAPTIGAVAAAPNRIDIDWDDSDLATVVEYLVRRSRTSGGPYETIAVVSDSSPGVANGPGYVYQDTTVSGSITYYYVVVASDGGACKTTSATEASATATGVCTLPPIFGGLQSVSTPYSGVCTLDLVWGSATPECGGPTSYNVYRSTTSGFTPGPGNLLVSGVIGNTLSDLNSLVSGTPYYYVVRAVDQANGVAEANTVQRTAIPKGTLVSGTWTDDAGDTDVAKLSPQSPWNVNTTEGHNGPKVYKTGTYGNSQCRGLVTPTLQLGTGSTLTFWSKYDLESGYDKGEVQISTNGGANWVRVPVNYPVNSIRNSDACGLPVGMYFTATNLTWGQYTADLSAWNGQIVLLRFVLSTDGSVVNTGWWIDDIAITQVDVPGTCSTGSSCADNPFVDVQPNGPLSACVGTQLTANVAGGNGPFTYSWTRDGLTIPGANGPTFTPADLGTHTYNCNVHGGECPDAVFDGFATQISATNAPSFGGVASVTDPQSANCSLNVSWSPGSTLCAGPVQYFVYRDTTSPVSLTPSHIVGPALSGTTFVDSGALADHQSYRYVVRALDASTGKFDSNVVEAVALPTGPGTGVYAAFTENFETPGSLGAWSVTVNPANKTCGVWAQSTSATQRPSSGSGGYALANFVGCGNPRIDTILTSPVINLGQSGIQSVTLDYDIYYNFQNGGDTATVEVWNGTAWQVIWTDTNADLNAHQTFNITAFAAGVSDFRVRFNYNTADQWFSVDNVVVTVDVLNPCSPHVGPPSVPDGSGGTTAMRGSRVTPSGDSIAVTWDTTTCSAAGYNLLYGDLANVSSYALSGSACGIGTGGSFTWNSVPAGDLFFLVVSTNGAGTEGSWGNHSQLGERHGLVPSGQCSITAKEISGTCP